MENPIDPINKVSPKTFRKHFMRVVKMCSRFDQFMLDVKAGEISFYSSCRFALTTSFLMTLISTAIYLLTSGQVNNYLFPVMILFTWVVILMCGIAFWIPATLCGGKSNLTNTLTGVFYLSIFLVLMRIIELPKMWVAHNEILKQSEPFQKDTAGLVSLGINQNDVASLFNQLLGLAFIALLYLTYRMLRIIHELDRIRAFVSTIGGMVLLYILGVYIQDPIVELFILANKDQFS